MARRRFFKKHGSSMKVTGIQAGGGAAVALIDRQILSSESGKKMFGSNTYVKPLVMLAGAHFLKGKAPNLCAGMAGAAGYMLVQAHYEQEDNKPVEGIVEAGATHYPGALGMGPLNANYNEAGAVFEVAR